MKDPFDPPYARPLDAFTLIRRHKGKMLLTFLAGIGLTLAYFSLAPRTFQSQAKLFVRLGRESVTLDPTVTTGQFVGVVDTRESEVLAVEELLTSRIAAEKIVDEFGPEVVLEKDPANSGPGLGERLRWLNDYNLNPFRVYSLHDKAVKAFQENLRVSSGAKTSVVTISYACEDPKLAQTLLTSLMAAASDEHLRIHRTRGSQEFFSTQSTLLQTHLAELEDQYRNLKNRSGVASLTTQREIQLQRIGALQTELLHARTERSAVVAENERRRQHMDDVPASSVSEQRTGQPHSTDQALRQKLYELEIGHAEMASKFTPDHPNRVIHENQLREARQIVKDEKIPVDVKTSPNPAHQAAVLAVHSQEAQLKALAARIASLEEQIAESQRGLQDLNDSEVEISRLEREIDLARVNCRKHAENLEQTRINQELEEAKISSLNVIQPPSFSETPLSPKPLPTLAFGFVLAVFGSFGVALVAHKLQGPAPAAVRGSVAHTAEPAPVVGHLATSFPRRSEIASSNPR